MPLFSFFLLVTGLMAQDVVDADVWMQKGIHEFQNAHYPEAVQAFEQAIAVDPNLIQAHLYLGTAYVQQIIPANGDPVKFELAMRAFQRALELDPKNRIAMASIAHLYLDQHNWNPAEQWYRRIAAVDSNNADAFYTLGYIAWSRWYPAYGIARAALGMTRTDRGPMPENSVKQNLKTRYAAVIDDGLQSLHRALEIKPDYADAMAYINLFIREQADLLDTKAEYEQAIKLADEWVDKALAAKKKVAEALPNPVQALPKRIKVGAPVAAARKIRDVAPVYSGELTNVRGIVKLAVIIGKDGKVIDIKLVSGHPLLVMPAMEAVKQWEYRPMLLNGEAIEVETEANVEFR